MGWGVRDYPQPRQRRTLRAIPTCVTCTDNADDICVDCGADICESHTICVHHLGTIFSAVLCEDCAKKHGVPVRECTNCGADFALRDRTLRCQDCHAEDVCPCCLQPAESELKRATKLLVCPDCYLADIRAMSSNQSEAA